MPKITIPVRKDYPANSVIDMAETLGRLTNTAVECHAVIEVTANEAVIKALAAIAPLAKGKRGKYSKAPADPAAAGIPEEVQEAAVLVLPLKEPRSE